MIYLSYQNHNFKPQIEYTFEVIFSVYGIEWGLAEYERLGDLQSKPGDILISYGRSKASRHSFRNHLHIYESELFSRNYLKPRSLPVMPPKRLGNLPLVYQGEGDISDGVIINMTPDRRTIETGVDIVASAFFTLSRYEELLLEKRDEHERFPAKESLAYEEGFLDRPIVNEYIELLWDWIKSLNPELERKPLWPDNKQFAVCLTHDVDMVRKYSTPPIMAIAGLLLGQGRPLSALNLAWDYLRVFLHIKKDPYDTFDNMLSLERQHGFKSSFYFMTAGDSVYDPRYSMDEAMVLNLIRGIEERGCEIGLHTGYSSYDSPERIALEKERLDGVVTNKNYGCRQHGLRGRYPNTWRHQEKARLLYDTSLAFADHIGFRGGMCLPFKPFDLIENRKLDIWELPLTVMEGTLQDSKYQGLSPEEAYEQILKHIEMVKRFKGVFVMLWHNSSFDPLGGWKGWEAVFQKTMEYLGAQDAFVATGREIIEWWEGRSSTGGEVVCQA